MEYHMLYVKSKKNRDEKIIFLFILPCAKIRHTAKHIFAVCYIFAVCAHDKEVVYRVFDKKHTANFPSHDKLEVSGSAFYCRHVNFYTFCIRRTVHAVRIVLCRCVIIAIGPCWACAVLFVSGRRGPFGIHINSLLRLNLLRRPQHVKLGGGGGDECVGHCGEGRDRITRAQDRGVLPDQGTRQWRVHQLQHICCGRPSLVDQILSGWLWLG